MLEERSFLVSKGFSRTCDHDNSWTYMSYRVDEIDVQNGKRPLEIDGEEEGGLRKLPKQSNDVHERVEFTLRLPDLSLSPVGQSSNQRQAGDNLEYREEEGRLRRLSKQSDVHEQVELTLRLPDLSLSPADQSSNQRQAGDNSSHREEEGGERNFSEQSNVYEQVALTLRLPDLSRSPADQSSNQRQAGDNSDSDSLIHHIGRDISISCLIGCSRSDYGSLASLNRSFRSLFRSGELYRLRRLKGVIEHWVYFSCRLLEWEAFDPNRRRWIRIPMMPSNQCFMSMDKESLAVGTQLLVFGKELMSHVIYKYSLLTNSWSCGMTMNSPRCLFGSASLGEIAILAGGCDSSGHILSSAELYNSESGVWETLPSMHKPRKMCSAVFMDEKFYVIGGIGGSDSKLLTCGEEYDLVTRTWREIPDMSPVLSSTAREAEMPASAEAPPLVAVVNNELYAADYADMEVRRYDKDRIIWVTVGRLPERADSMNGWGLAFRACGSQLIVIGGPRAMGEGFIEVNSWIPSDGPAEWNLLGRKQFGNFVYNCAVMGC